MYKYEHIHTHHYDYTSTGLEGDLQFYLEEAQKAGSPVLELGCGTAYWSAWLARRSADVVGLDLSDISEIAASDDWQVALSAVVEDASGDKSYWASAHPPGRPDFHHPDSFALHLPA